MSEIDVQIERIEAELFPLCERMEELKWKFIKETVIFAREWYKKTIKEYISKYPEVTLNMKEAKMVLMKNQVNELVRETETIVRDKLEKPILWWHQRPRLHDSIEQYLQVADKYPEILDRAVRYALGRLGLILEEYAYNVAASSNKGSFLEFWFDHPLGADSASVPYYPHLLKWSEEMQEIVHEYNAMYLKAIAVFEKVQILKDEKKRQQAMNRWDTI